MRTVTTAIIMATLLALPAVAQLLPEEEAFLDSLDLVPSTPEEFSAFHPSDQRVIYKSLDPAAKSSLWQEKFLGYIDTHPELSEDQLRVISFAMSLATPDIFSIHPGDLLWEAAVAKPIEGLSDLAFRLFDEREINEIFFTIGWPSHGEPSSWAMAPKGLKGGRDCDCLYALVCPFSCYYGWDCNKVIGCGFLGLEICTGVCSSKAAGVEDVQVGKCSN